MSPGGAATEDEKSAPWFARPFVVAFLGVLLVCPLFSVEAWPLTSFRLFSHLRHDEQTSWQAFGVDGRSREVRYPVASLGQGFRGFVFEMRTFAARSPNERDALCETWLEGARRAMPGHDVKTVRLYQTHWLLSRRRGRRALPPTRTLRYVCLPRGARATT
jgi:hypothetical protein